MFSSTGNYSYQENWKKKKVMAKYAIFLSKIQADSIRQNTPKNSN
jgi:hypothetical protein